MSTERTRSKLYLAAAKQAAYEVRVPAYRVKHGLNYPAPGGGPERRAEPGDVVTDLPMSSLLWLLADGIIEEVTD